MFGIPSLYLKIGAWVVLVAAVYGGYKYVDNLRNSNENLKEENIQLIEMNETLTDSLIEVQRLAQNRDEVGAVSREIREENVRVRQKNDRQINQSVSEGKDREVGPVLKEFFNAK